MLVYVLNFASIGLYAGICMVLKGKKSFETARAVLFSILTLQMILLLGLRHIDVGIDTSNYYPTFLKALQEGYTVDFARKESFFAVLLYIVTRFTDDYNIFLFVIACITIIPVFITIYKYSPSPFLSVALFIAFNYYALTFSGLRQMIAQGLCFFSYKYIKDKKLLAFVALTLIAAQFHQTAYFFLPAYLFASVKIKPSTFIWLLLLWVLVYFFRAPLYSLVENTMYAGNPLYAQKETNAFLWMAMMLIIVIACLIFYVSKCSGTRDERWLSIFIMLLAVGAVMMLFNRIGSSASRLGSYYTIFLIMAIPGIIPLIESPKINTSTMLIITVMTTGMFIWSIVTDLYKIIPYRLYF